MGFWKDLAFLNYLNAKDNKEKLDSLFLYSLEEEKDEQEKNDYFEEDEDDEFDEDDDF